MINRLDIVHYKSHGEGLKLTEGKGCYMKQSGKGLKILI